MRKKDTSLNTSTMTTISASINVMFAPRLIRDQRSSLACMFDWSVDGKTFDGYCLGLHSRWLAVSANDTIFRAMRTITNRLSIIRKTRSVDFRWKLPVHWNMIPMKRVPRCTGCIRRIEREREREREISVSRFTLICHRNVYRFNYSLRALQTLQTLISLGALQLRHPTPDPRIRGLTIRSTFFRILWKFLKKYLK